MRQSGEEKIGVLEVLNKVGGEPFYEEELLILPLGSWTPCVRYREASIEV